MPTFYSGSWTHFSSLWKVLKDQQIRWIGPSRGYKTTLNMTIHPRLLTTGSSKFRALWKREANTWSRREYHIQHVALQRAAQERPYVNALKSTPDILPGAAALLYLRFSLFPSLSSSSPFPPPSTCLDNSISGHKSRGIKSLFPLKGAVTKGLRQPWFPQRWWVIDIHAVGKPRPTPSLLIHTSTDVTNERPSCTRQQVKLFNVKTRWKERDGFAACSLSSDCCFNLNSSVGGETSSGVPSRHVVEHTEALLKCKHKRDTDAWGQRRWG